MMKCLLLFNVFYLLLAGLVIIIICHCLKTFSNKYECVYHFTDSTVCENCSAPQFMIDYAKQQEND